MINPAQIPDEVVEAAARAICELTGNHPRWMYWKPEALAAIAAALNTWPGMTHMEPDLANGIIILPLPQQDSDE
jgi:hypothetical protein